MHVGLDHGLDFVLERFDDLLYQLALHVEELDAEPDVGDVVFAGDHQVEAVDLVRLVLLLLPGVCDLGILTAQEEFLSQLDGLIAQVPTVSFFLADVVGACHSPLRNLPLDHKLYVELVVDLKTTIDNFDAILLNHATEAHFSIVFLVCIVFSVIVSALVAHFFHSFGLFKHFCALILLPLFKTDVAENDRAENINVR